MKERDAIMRAGTEDKLESASFPEEEKGIRRRKISSKSAEGRETDKKKILNTTNEEKEKDKTESSSTPYDDVFKTLLNDCTFLIIPVISEVFHEHYRGDEKIEFHKNDHYINGQKGDAKKVFTDNCFDIYGKTKKTYHVECQSTSDSSMLVRMFEYGAQVALDEGSD